jgi:hypothetical protein
MLLLGSGVAAMTVVKTTLQWILTVVARGPIVAVTPTITDLLGMCLISYAAVLTRGE